MDVSVLAAVGSFVVSERVLKPKATVLALLGCVLAYDLTTKTQDVASLRAYRGPGLLAFTLMMTAFSLRTWRRNGIACDELLFLPGTPHGDTHGIDEAGAVVLPPHHLNGSTMGAPLAGGQSEGDVAAGVGSGPRFHHHQHHPPHHHHPQPPSSSRRVLDVPLATSPSTSLSALKEADGLGGQVDSDLENPSKSTPSSTGEGNGVLPFRQRSNLSSRASSPSSSIQDFVNSWDDEDDRSLLHGEDDEDGHDDPFLQGETSEEAILRMPLTGPSATTNSGGASNRITSNHSSHKMGTSSERKSDQNNSANSMSNKVHRPLELSPGAMDGEAVGGVNTSSASGPVERFRENHPRITRLGSFFFFRSTSSSTQNAAYAPSGPAVVGAALDMSMPILFNFHLFIEAFNHVEPGQPDTTAKILPLIFLSVLMVRTVIPPGRRGRFWNTMKFTFMAPFHRSRFRDSFIGDVLTSLVRPLQDIVFALAYYVTVVWGTVSGNHTLSESGQVLQYSWFLHNVVLPSVALLPLWFRFLQTLREAYDSGHRWPHLGNAFKYLISALVILYGMTHPEDRRSSWWLVCFVLTLLYQIWWDTVMDWDLFVWSSTVSRSTLSDEPMVELVAAVDNHTCCNRLSSLRPHGQFLLAFYRHFWQPLLDVIRWILSRLPNLRQIQLRPRRLYKSDAFYWRIFAYNAVFRVAWMLSFIPAYRLSASGGRESLQAFSSDTKSYVGVLLPALEIFRRTLWGFLFLEKKTIQMTFGDAIPSSCFGICSGRSASTVDDEMNDTKYDQEVEGKFVQGGLPPEQQQSSVLPVGWMDMSNSRMPTDSWATWSGNFACGRALWWSWQALPQDEGALSSNLPAQSIICHKLWVAELSLWAVAFVGLGLWATT